MPATKAFFVWARAINVRRNSNAGLPKAPLDGKRPDKLGQTLSGRDPDEILTDIRRMHKSHGPMSPDPELSGGFGIASLLPALAADEFSLCDRDVEGSGSTGACRGEGHLSPPSSSSLSRIPEWTGFRTTVSEVESLKHFQSYAGFAPRR